MLFFILLSLAVFNCMSEKNIATVGEKAPLFHEKAIFNGSIIDVSLKQYLGKYVVLLFYPMDFTFVCPTELIAFSKRIKEFEKMNASIVAISTDSEYTHLAWTKTPVKEGGVGELNFPLVSDVSKEISKQYNVLKNGRIALRGLFVIDEEGVLCRMEVNDLSVGRSVDETLRVVSAFSETKRTGSVCPVDWKHGDETLIPTPNGIKKYMSSR